MKTLLVKVDDLKGAQLDWAVAKANGWIDYPLDSIEQGSIWHTEPNKSPFGKIVEVNSYKPSTDWSQGGPIIEREGISVARDATEWAAWTWARIRDNAEHFGYADTPLIAAMRCYVVSKLGDEIEVPEGFK